MPLLTTSLDIFLIWLFSSRRCADPAPFSDQAVTPALLQVVDLSEDEFAVSGGRVDNVANEELLRLLLFAAGE